jgi:hypothetical protein
MNKNPMPLSLPSSTKTMVGLPESEPPPASEPPAAGADSPQRTLLGAGPEHIEAVDAFLNKPVSQAPLAPPAGAPEDKKTLVGMPSEPPPARKEEPSLVPLSFGERALSHPSSSPMSWRPAPVSGPTSLSSAQRQSLPTVADLPFQRPVVAAIGVAAAVAVWALMMLYLLGI